MKIDITSLVDINRITVYSSDLIDYLEIEWFNDTFPDISSSNRIDIKSDGTCVLELRTLKEPYRPGNYNISYINLTDKQSDEFKTIQKMRYIFGE